MSSSSSSDKAESPSDALPWMAPGGKKLKEGLLAIFGLLSVVTNFPEGYCNAYPNTAHAEMKNMINQSYVGRGHEGGMSTTAFTWYWSLLLNVWYLGYLVGTVATPFLNDNLGRKRALLIALFGNFLSVVAVIAGQPEVLMISRIIASVSFGISFGSMIIFLQESSPTEQRGSTSFMCESTFVLTMAIGIFAGMEAVFGRNLPLLTGVALVPAVISILIILPLKDTPKYLLINCGDRAAAMESLVFYRGQRDDHDETLDEMMLEKQMGEKEEKVGILEGIKEVVFEGHLRMAFFMGVAALQIIVGFWPVTYLSTDLLEANFDSWTSQMASLAFIMADFVASMVGTAIIEKFNRRTLLLSVSVANTLCLVVYVAADLLIPFWPPSRWGQIIALILFGITYGIALGPIAFFITSELVAQRSRAVVQSMVLGFNTILNFIFSTATLPLYTSFGAISFLFLLVLPSIICIVFLYFFLPETQGREIHSVVEEMMRRYNKKRVTGVSSTDKQSSSASIADTPGAASSDTSA